MENYLKLISKLHDKVKTHQNIHKSDSETNSSQNKNKKERTLILIAAQTTANQEQKWGQHTHHIRIQKLTLRLMNWNNNGSTK